MTGGIEVLHLAVIGPLVRHVEGRADGAAVGVVAALLEQVGVQALVEVVDRVIEGQEDDLRYLLRQVFSYDFVLSVVGGRWSVVGGRWWWCCWR
jgi:hypothetical protein